MKGWHQHVQNPFGPVPLIGSTHTLPFFALCPDCTQKETHTHSACYISNWSFSSVTCSNLLCCPGLTTKATLPRGHHFGGRSQKSSSVIFVPFLPSFPLICHPLMLLSEGEDTEIKLGSCKCRLDFAGNSKSCKRKKICNQNSSFFHKTIKGLFDHFLLKWCCFKSLWATSVSPEGINCQCIL